MSLRTRELAFLVLASLAVAAAYATMYVAHDKILSAAALAFGGFFFLLMLLAHMAVRTWAPLADPYLLPGVTLLVGFGITMISRLDESLARRQIAWLVGSVILFALLLALVRNHHLLERYKYLIGATGVLALVATVSPLGHEVNGSRLWIGFGPINIQPGEFSKLAIVIFLAAYLREHRELLQLRLSPKDLGPLVVFWGMSLALLVLMNDFGTSLLFYATFLMMLYVATSRTSFVVAGLAAFVGGSWFVYHHAAHVRERFDVWLNPFASAQTHGYQLVQGLFALADGGIFGRGLGRAYLVTPHGQTLIPAASTDFIFAALADELGFVGAIGLLLVYVVVAWRGFAIAARCSDGFSKLLAFGLSATFLLQTVIIVGGVVRLLPLTGQTLPFVSYGGSSLLANFLLVGLLLVISHRSRISSEVAPGLGIGVAA